ncbi:MAG TPA: hypothetical protein VGG94_05295 [Chthoniobacterales bacterium]
MDLPLSYLKVHDSGLRRLLLAALAGWLACAFPFGAQGTVCDLTASPGWTAGPPTIKGPDQKVDYSSTSPITYNRLPEAAPWWSTPIACVVVSAVEFRRWRRRKKADRV